MNNSFIVRLLTVTTLSLTSPDQTVLAQQLVETGGGTLTRDGGSYTATGEPPSMAAVYAANSESKIYASNITIQSSSIDNSYMAVSTTGAAIYISGDSRLSGERGLLAEGAGSLISMTGGTISGVAGSVIARAGGAVELKDVAVTDSGTTGAVRAEEDGTVIISGGAVTATNPQNGSRAISIYKGQASIDGTTITSAAEAVYNLGGNLEARKFAISTTGATAYGINANDASTSDLSDGEIRTKGYGAHGIWAVNSDPSGSTEVTGERLAIVTDGESASGASADSARARITLTTSNITVLKTANGVRAQHGGQISLQDSTVTISGDGGAGAIALEAGSKIALENVSIEATGAGARGIRARAGGTVTATSSTIVASGNGLTVESGATARLADSTVATTGADAFGLLFSGTTALNAISITGSRVEARYGTAIVATGGTDVLTVKDTVVSGDGLLAFANDLDNQGTLYGSKLSLNADHSALTGGARMTALSTNNVTLQNDSTWILTPAADGSTESAVTSLTVEDSTVAFSAPATESYQTLVVGAGAAGTPAWSSKRATLVLNTRLSSGGALSDQQTDRLLVNGDVAGTTQVKVIGVPGSPGGDTSAAGNNLPSEGISIIQVSGASTENAFQLSGGYTTLNGLPYQYRLYAYGPGASSGAADETQRLIPGDTAFWDYRLQSVYITPEPDVQEVAPQLPSYLIAPIALFQAGLQDVSNLHRRLGEIREDRSAGRNSGTGEFFIRAYGGTYDYSSNRNAYTYGYDANIDYAALQMGGNLYALEQGGSITRFGLAGTIGSLSYDPKRVGSASSGDADTWSVSAHATYLHDSGFYVDGTVSFGAFDGNVSTNLRGRTASVSGNTLAVSVEAGRPFRMGDGLMLEPQVQVVYQRLMFDRTRDVDNIAVALGQPDQVMGRIGARLSKSLATGANRPLTVYVKANVLHAFSDGGTVFLGDTFRLGRFGTSIEGGIGINAAVMKNLSVYADAAYGQKVGASGVSGISLTGGLRYSF